MYSKNEELIDFEFTRDIKNNKFSVQYLTASTRNEIQHTLTIDQYYISNPLHYKWGYVFKLGQKKIYYFAILKDELGSREFSYVQFNSLAIQEDDTSSPGYKRLRKILDRATLEEGDDAKSLFNILKIELFK